jgi:AbrB family looped-hinge helix DNA binding protein
MKFAAKVGERGQVVIPKAIREELAIGKNTSLEFELKGKTLTLSPKKDMEKMRATLARFQGTLQEKFEADGFTSTAQFMKEMRGR